MIYVKRVHGWPWRQWWQPWRMEIVPFESSMNLSCLCSMHFYFVLMMYFAHSFGL
jgi:hypothetical protein